MSELNIGGSFFSSVCVCFASVRRGKLFLCVLVFVLIQKDAYTKKGQMLATKRIKKGKHKVSCFMLCVHTRTNNKEVLQ